MQYIQDKAAFYKYIYQNCHCVNAQQSNDKSRMKYKLARYFGCNSYQARRVRYWRDTQFTKRFGYSSLESMLKILGQ